MKLIPKKLQGGSFTSFFASYTPFIPLAAQLLLQAPSRQTREPSAKDNNSSKDIMAMLNKIDALPNELSSLTNQIQEMYGTVYMGGEPDPAILTSLYTSVEYGIKLAAFNKKEYDKAYQMASRNKSLNEVAIDSYGNMYVYNKDKELESISIDTYLKNRDKYMPIDNSNLLWLRAHDPLFANNNQVFNIINNSIGMEEVVKLIRANLGNLGSDIQEVSGYVNKGPNKQVIAGILALKELAELQGEAAVKGIYKVTSKSKDSNRLALAAISWIWDSLSPNAQTLLKLKGGDYKNPTKGALNLISKKVMSIMNNTISYNEDYLDDFNLDGTLRPKGSSGEGGEGKPPKENAALRYMNGRGYRETVNILPGDNMAGLVDSVTAVITDKEDKPFDGKYLSELEATSFGTNWDLQHATMGGLAITNPKEVLLLTNKVHSVFWPTLADGITPDLGLDTIEQMKQADAEIELLGINPESQEALKIKAKYIRSGNLRRFSIIDAITNNNALGMDSFDSNNLLQSVDDRTLAQYELTYEDYWSKGKTKERIDFDHNDWYNPLDWFGNHDEVYKGTVWIPHMDNYSNALSGTGEGVYTDVAQDWDLRQFTADSDLQARLNYNNPAQYE